MFARRCFALALAAGLLSLGLAAATAADEKDKKGDKKDEPRKGTVTGVLIAKGMDKGATWIEVKADGEEKARKYVPMYSKGGAKDMVAKINETPVNSRVRVEWEFQERPRVVKLEVLGKKDEKK